MGLFEDKDLALNIRGAVVITGFSFSFKIRSTISIAFLRFNWKFSRVSSDEIWLRDSLELELASVFDLNLVL